MIAAFSTSSPLSSVCLASEAGQLIWEGELEAPGRASETCIQLLLRALSESQIELRSINCFVSDVGPGSFTGVRVGIVLAKTLAWNNRVACAAVDAFDLIDPDRPVAIPSRKNEYFLRTPGFELVKVTEVPSEAVGYGYAEGKSFPKASGVVRLVDSLSLVSAMELMPRYLSEPSISTPKRPLSRVSN